MSHDLKALVLGQKAHQLADLAFAAADHRLSDMSRLHRAIRELDEAKAEFLGKD